MRGKVVTPMWDWVLIRKDPDSRTTEGGVILPGGMKVPRMSGKIVSVGPEAVDDVGNPLLYPGDRVMIHFQSDTQMVDLEDEDSLILVPVECCIAKTHYGERPKGMDSDED